MKKIAVVIIFFTMICSCGDEALSIQSKHLEVYDIFPDDTEEQIRSQLVGVESIGELRIFNQDDLVDLSLFNTLKSIDKLLLSGCDGMSSLTGMSSVEIKWLMVVGCDKLGRIDNVDQLERVEKIDISNCQSLRLIDLSNCVSASDVYIGQLNELEEINMASLEVVGSDLTIEGCSKLVQLNLENLEEIAGVLGIQSNPILENLDYMGNLKKVDQVLIRSNLSLSDIGGLERLAEIEEINMWGNKIDDFCVFKSAVLNNPAIELNIQGESIYRIDADYFDNCQ